MLLTCWLGGGAHVSESVLRVSVKEIRAALGDAAPRYLETVERQGYRFLGGGDLEVVWAVSTAGASVVKTNTQQANKRLAADGVPFLCFCRHL